MKCEFVKLPDGGTAVLCSPRRRRRCDVCGNLGASKLCDGPPRPGSRAKTCDRNLCTGCARHVEGQDRDYCPEHAQLAGEQLTLTPNGGEAAMPPEPGKPAHPPEPGPAARPAPPAPATERWTGARCKRCSAPIVFALMPTGRAMPVDPVPNPMGNVVLYRNAKSGDVTGRTVTEADPVRPGEQLRTSHFQTCPQAGSFRRGKRGRRA